MKRAILILSVLAILAAGGVAVFWSGNAQEPAKPVVNVKFRQHIETDPQRFLNGQEGQVHRLSAIAIAEWKDALVPTCAAILKDSKDSAAKQAAVKLLSEARNWNVQANDALLDVIHDDTCADVHLMAAESLALVAPTDALKRLATFHDHSNSAIRIYAAIAKVHLARGSDGELSLLLAGLEHSDYTVRFHVAQTLGMFPPQNRNALPALVKALESAKDILETSSIMQAMSKQKAQAADAVAILSKLLRDASPHVRGSACTALGGMGLGARPALDELRGRLNDSDPNVSQFASFAIHHIETAKPAEQQSLWPLAGFALLGSFALAWIVFFTRLRRRAKREVSRA